MGFLDRILADEAFRLEQFPVARDRVFLGHAGVTVLPQRVASATISYLERSCSEHQEFEDFLGDVKKTRELAAQIIHCDSTEIALLGPTSLGLSLFANGLSWQPGDEVVCYFDDFPANVYPWLNLEQQGVQIRYLEPETPGKITVDLVERALTPKTRLVALASCHFFTGRRIDVESIGRMLREKDILFSLDAIQTVGAFPTSVEYVDFLSADAHKWMLGPMAIGIVYVRKALFERLRPTLLGAWNVLSPNFLTQPEIRFLPTAQRYEPGVLNATGVIGMKAALELLTEVGIGRVSERLLSLKRLLVSRLAEKGYEINGPGPEEPEASSITTFTHSGKDIPALFDALKNQRIEGSLRFDREKRPYLRFSPHFYNTEEELERALAVL